MRHVAISFPFADAASSAGVTVSPPQRMDEAAFQTFYLAVAPRLWSYVRRASGNTALADDVLQETFYKFLRADLPPMDDVQRKAYLYRTASTLLADHWRRIKRERRWSLANFFGGETSQPAEAEGGAMREFARLKPRDQSLLWLAYVEGFSHAEIAGALHLGEKSVRVLLFRARGKLAGHLRKQGFGPEEKS